MKEDASGQLVFSPSGFVRYLGSPFASWMDRYFLENPGTLAPDEETEDERLIAQTGEQHEQTVFEGFKPVLKVAPIQAGMIVFVRAHFLTRPFSDASLAASYITLCCTSWRQDRWP